MTKELFEAAINRCITNSSHDVSFTAMAAVLRDKAAHLDSISDGVSGNSIVKNVERDDSTGHWRMTTADGKVHYVSRDVLVTAFSAASHAAGKEYPWVDDATGFAVALKPALADLTATDIVDTARALTDDEIAKNKRPDDEIIDCYRSALGIVITTGNNVEHLVGLELARAVGFVTHDTTIGKTYPFVDNDQGVAQSVKLEQTQEDDPAKRTLVEGQQPDAADEAARQRAIFNDDTALTNGQPALDEITAKVGQDEKAASEAAKPEGDGPHERMTEAPKPKDETSFPMVKVEKSSNITEIGHQGTELRVRFKGKGDKPGSLYAYDGVPASVATEMMASDSAGKFLADKIKGIYPARKIEPTES